MKKNNSFCVCPLASGSKGNALLVSTPDTAILVDAGLSGVELQRRMAAVGQDPADLSAIVITHEHIDHVRGAGVLSRRFNIPVYISSATHQACTKLGHISALTYFDCGNRFQIQDLTVTPFSISHDASDPAGLTVTWQERKIGIATDLGVVTNLVRTHLSGSDVLYLESNHDPEMLTNGSYPWHLKQRIKSRVGHLSNHDAGTLLADLYHDQLHHVILAHLSEENNRPERALAEVGQCLNRPGIALCVAGPERPGDVIRIAGEEKP
ncbi:MAG: MBL fold metallo-hydrolase [Desulfotignum sp.]|nr:MBL fold metallo-hydrolase [Desulfotignum sp.]MCF8086561.1 MBL fold metallo-hydrolase [Desulfotignum sp.]MCF8136167.1 MBL fold metallo-hydrolase [Desulfotignum sp.]